MEPYLIGLLFGDGTSQYSKSNRAYQVWIDQHVRNEYIAEEAQKKFKELGFNVHYYYFLNKVRARIYAKPFFLLFRKMRTNPNEFFENLASENKLRFIAGFFDAEGTVTDRYVLYNREKELLILVQEFLQTKNIKSYIYRFGKVFGLQIYRKKDMLKFQEIIPALKIDRILSVKKLS